MFRDSITLGGCALEEHVKAEGRYGIGSNSASSCDNDGERPEGTYTETADTSLVIDIESDSGYSFHSVTGRNTYDYQDGIDADWLPVQFVGRADISNYEQTSQEFRIASPTDDRFSFVAGVYWSESEQEIDRVVQVDGTLGNPLNVNGVTAFGAAQGTYGQGGTDSFLAIPVEAIAEAGLEAAGALVGLTELQIDATVDAWLFPANPDTANVYDEFWCRRRDDVVTGW